MRDTSREKIAMRPLGAALIFLCVNALADTQVTYTFKDGETAEAAEVNQNFTDLATAIDNSRVPLALSFGEFSPWIGEPAAITLIECADVEPLLRNTLQIKLDRGNAAGYVAATKIPAMDLEALSDLTQVLSELFRNPLLKRSYAMRLLSREATSGAVDDLVTKYLHDCNSNGWFQQLEASPFSANATQN